MGKELDLKWGRILGLPICWVVVVALIVMNVQNNPSPLVGSDYGHNTHEQLWMALISSFCELVLVWGGLNMWSEDRGLILHACVVVGLFLWTMICALMSMHGGGALMIHLLWLVGLVLCVGTWLGVRILSKLSTKQA